MRTTLGGDVSGRWTTREFPGHKSALQTTCISAGQARKTSEPGAAAALTTHPPVSHPAKLIRRQDAEVSSLDRGHRQRGGHQARAKPGPSVLCFILTTPPHN